ncbi:hypothetical protein EV06_0870 [Prochlorococcus sp. MIT 0602]|nr:hypothetical protein EV06_0870 [Prochlorococcus sp. MIT 0602]KGG17280.1 hypothetical protein EV07_0718 [Prochlorococcus sp. MIT 0603]
MKVLKPDQILKVLKIDEYEELEKKLHKKYKHARIPQTEYFRLDKQQLSECKRDLSISSYRRGKCNPLFIGIITILTSPLSCIFWGIRQSSLKLAVLPFTVIFIAGYIHPPVMLNEKTKFTVHLAAGLIAFVIARKNKIKALN